MSIDDDSNGVNFRGSPSSRLAPVMSGMRENLPSAMSFDGKSGMSPSGPSMTGTNWKLSGDSAEEVLYALRSVARLAPRIHEKVSFVVALPAHSGVALTKLVHSISRRVAFNTGIVPANPELMI